MTYQIPAAPAQASFVVKKSQFIAHAYPLAHREQLVDYVQQLRGQYPDARHICYGYIIGDPTNTTSAGFFDGGEPSGTAGRPILALLQHKNIGDCALLVVRYFGGVKLGAGGLSRAYGKAAALALDAMALRPFVAKVRVQIITDFAHEAYCRHCIAGLDGQVLAADYRTDVCLLVQLDATCLPELAEQLGASGVINKDG